MKSKKKSTRKPAKKPSSREYDNSARALKSAQTQKAIIEALVQLLVERRGGDVQMADVAERTGITPRTIFRFFKDKKTLHEAMDHYLMSYLQAGTEQMESRDFVGFGKNVFKLFDKYESLTMAYVLSPFGMEARKIFRKKLNQVMLQRIKVEWKLEMNSERAKRLALITSLINAKIWFDLKEDYGYTGEDMSDSIEWALKTLLKNC